MIEITFTVRLVVDDEATGEQFHDLMASDHGQAYITDAVKETFLPEGISDVTVTEFRRS